MLVADPARSLHANQRDAGAAAGNQVFRGVVKPVSALLDRPVYGPREDGEFLSEMEQLTLHHLAGCKLYKQIWRGWQSGGGVAGLPFLHVGLFKRLLFCTDGLAHERILQSSSTISSQPSQIILDKISSQLQSRSALAILKDFVGERKRPLLILDDSKSLRQRGTVSARMAAALSLSPLATSMHFLLADAGRPESMKWDDLRSALAANREFLIYGSTWLLWLSWGAGSMPEDIRRQLQSKRIHFVHSGGWKKLEHLRVNREEFDTRLTRELQPGSGVVVYYGLVEQVGVIYPLCEHGFRHVPIWADVLVRDPYTLQAVEDQIGQIQLMNTLAHGAPYHSVLSEDVGSIISGPCPCGRSGKRFELLGRIPQAEVRGCANV